MDVFAVVQRNVFLSGTRDGDAQEALSAAGTGTGRQQQQQHASSSFSSSSSSALPDADDLSEYEGKLDGLVETVSGCIDTMENVELVGQPSDPLAAVKVVRRALHGLSGSSSGSAPSRGKQRSTSSSQGQRGDGPGPGRSQRDSSRSSMQSVPVGIRVVWLDGGRLGSTQNAALIDAVHQVRKHIVDVKSAFKIATAATATAGTGTDGTIANGDGAETEMLDAPASLGEDGAEDMATAQEKLPVSELAGQLRVELKKLCALRLVVGAASSSSVTAFSASSLTDEHPRVLFVLEQFENFVDTAKQRVLYALLDMMHSTRIRASVIAISAAADTREYLEKRVMSRFQGAQHHVPPPRKLASLYKMLVLPTSRLIDAAGTLSIQGGGSDRVIQWNEMMLACFRDDGFRRVVTRALSLTSDVHGIALDVVHASAGISACSADRVAAVTEQLAEDRGITLPMASSGPVVEVLAGFSVAQWLIVGGLKRLRDSKKRPTATQRALQRELESVRDQIPQFKFTQSLITTALRAVIQTGLVVPLDTQDLTKISPYTLLMLDCLSHHIESALKSSRTVGIPVKLESWILDR